MPVRVFLLALLAGCAATSPAPSRNPLHGVRSWAIQLNGLTREGAVERLERARADLIVIEPTRTVRGRESFATAELVGRLRRERLCLAYLNVGQAESYRTYWRVGWRAPQADQRGSPAYLLSTDPNGWPENFPVAYWDFRWRGVLWGSPDAPVDQAIADGFDGLYLDWVLGFADTTVAAAARDAGVDPAAAMVELVSELRAYAQRRKPGFLLIAQNGAPLVVRRPEFADVIDGVSQESLSFGGRAAAAWDDPAATDLPADGSRAEALALCRARGLPVFTLDYAARVENVSAARARSKAMGFVPFVSRTPLDRLP